MTDKIQSAVENIIQDSRKSLTTRQRRFVREFVEDPTSATEAAVRAGYSQKSARFIASRLLKDPDIQSELAQHFVDQERELSESLTSTLLRLRTIVESGSDDKFFKASKLLLEYGRMASSILGLEIKSKPKAQASESEPTSLEDLLEQHRAEVERLERLLAVRTAGHAPAIGEGAVQ